MLLLDIKAYTSAVIAWLYNQACTLTSSLRSSAASTYSLIPVVTLYWKNSAFFGPSTAQLFRKVHKDDC